MTSKDRDMKNILIACLLMCGSILACAENPKGDKNAEKVLTPDTTVVKELGNSLSNLLFAPQKVKCYYISKKKNIPEGQYQPIKGFARDSLLATLSSKEIAIIQYLLINNKGSYSFDKIAIEAPNIPELEFEFSAGKKKIASVIISTSDRTWQIMYDGKQQIKYNYADARSLERFCQHYINLYYNPKANKKNTNKKANKKK